MNPFSNKEYSLIEILFVDDEESILNTLRRFLHPDKEFSIFTTTKISEALQIIETHTINVVVSDLTMPEMSGIEFLKIVKKKYPNMVTILLTGHATLETAQEAVNSVGIFSLILKPWNGDDLRTSLNKAVQEAIRRNTMESFIDLSMHSRNSARNLDITKFQVILAQWSEEYGPKILYSSPSIANISINEFINHAFMTLTSIYGQNWYDNRTIINLPIEYVQIQSHIYFDYLNSQISTEQKYPIILVILLPVISKIIETALNNVIIPFLDTIVQISENVFVSSYKKAIEELFLQVKSTLQDIKDV